MNVMIIEDELASQQYLQGFLKQNFPELPVVALSDNVPEAITLLQKYSPDILFLDIEIKMGTGFDVLNAFAELKSEVIFTTAFNQFAINAFEYHAVDYLLKPIEESRLRETIKRCIGRLSSKDNSLKIAALLSDFQHSAVSKKRISIHTLNGIEFIDVDTILFAMAKGNYTELKLKSGGKITVTKKLKEIEESLPPSHFYRIHHSYVVQSSSIKKYYKGRGGSVTLSDDTSLPVSSARRDDFLKHFDS